MNVKSLQFLPHHFSCKLNFSKTTFSFRKIRVLILTINFIFFIALVCLPADIVSAQQSCNSLSKDAAHECQKPKDPLQKKLSPGEFAGLTAAMVLSPGIGLFKVAHNARKQGHDFGIIGWLTITIIAVIDLILDKVAFISAIQQWAQHLIIWGTAYLASMYLGEISNVGVLILIASVLQLLRQGGSFVIDLSVIGAPIRSTIEDIFALLIPI